MIEEGFVGTIHEFWEMHENEGFFFCRPVGREKWRTALFIKYRQALGGSSVKACFGKHYYIVDLYQYGRLIEPNLHYAHGGKQHIFLGSQKINKKSP